MEGFLQKVERARADRLDRRRNVSKGRDQNDGRCNAFGQQLLLQSQPAESRQAHIHDQAVRALGQTGKLVEKVLSGLVQSHDHSGRFQHHAHRVAHLQIVIDHMNRWDRCFHGRLRPEWMVFSGSLSLNHGKSSSHTELITVARCRNPPSGRWLWPTKVYALRTLREGEENFYLGAKKSKTRHNDSSKVSNAAHEVRIRTAAHGAGVTGRTLPMSCSTADRTDVQHLTST
jgi:hypothetical protein